MLASAIEEWGAPSLAIRASTGLGAARPLLLGVGLVVAWACGRNGDALEDGGRGGPRVGAVSATASGKHVPPDSNPALAPAGAPSSLGEGVRSRELPEVWAIPRPRPSRPEQAESLVILAGGDVNLGRGLGRRILRDPSVNPFAEIAPYLASADLRFVNLESQLSDQQGETQSLNPLVFTGPPGGADLLARAKIDLVSIANNHIWDYGKPAFLETLANLERVQVAASGGSREPNGAYEPRVVKKNGWSIAWFSVTQIWNQGRFDLHPGKDHIAWASPQLLGPKIRQARQENDLVLVSYHGGAETVDFPMTWSQEVIRAFVHEGADAVFGHHPHVPQGVGWPEGRPVFYSLGNLVFPMHSKFPWTGIGFLARLTFWKSGKFTAEACPYRILGETPIPFLGTSGPLLAQQFRRHLVQTSIAVGRSVVGEPQADGCLPLSPPPTPPR